MPSTSPPFSIPADWYRWAVQSVRTYAFFTCDVQNRIRTWDQGAVALFGYRREDVIGEDARFIFTPQDIRNHVPETEIATAVGNRSAPDERWHVRKDGSIFWASGRMMVLTDDAERHVGFVKIVRECPPPSAASPGIG
jgi:PAS domain S-box-containing protein